MSELETMLREKFADAVERPPAAIPIEAVRARVSRRRRAVAMAAAAAVAAIVIPAAVFAAASDDGRRAAPEPVGPARETGVPSPDDVASLPEGPPPQVPWTFQHTLRLGSAQVPVPGNIGPDLIGSVRGGWFLLAARERPGSYFESWYVILHPDGSVTRLPNLQTSGKGQVQEAAVSPDGTQVAAQAVVDVATGDVDATLPSEAQYMVGWGAAGMVYETGTYGSHRPASFLWTPGGAPVRIDGAVSAVADASSRVLTRDHGSCNSVATLGDDGLLTRLWQGCGSQMPSILSPDGERVITAGFAVVDVDTGTVVPIPGLDRRRSPLWRFAWEDSDHVVFPLDGTWMVRCSVETLECERAAGPISITPNDDINVPGAN